MCVRFFPGIFRIAFQSFRLFRRHRQHNRNDFDANETHVTAGRVGVTLRSATQGLQSYQVSNDRPTLTVPPT